LTRRLGPELVDDLTREVVRLAIRDRGFRVRAMRCDSNVQESDVRFPTDCGLAADAVKVLARVARKVHAAIPGLTRKVRDRSRAAGRRIRELNRTLARRTGDAKQEVQRLTEEIAELARPRPPPCSRRQRADDHVAYSTRRSVTASLSLLVDA
jgi:transposase, IS5 family